MSRKPHRFTRGDAVIRKGTEKPVMMVEAVLPVFRQVIYLCVWEAGQKALFEDEIDLVILPESNNR